MTNPQKISHALQLMSSADSMRMDSFICDFKIKVGSRTYNTHRLVLAAHSGYFKALFSSDMKEASQGFAVMDHANPTSMQNCIDYMYTSKCDIRSYCASTLQLANYLQMKKLEESCLRHLLKSVSPSNCLSLLNFARTYRHQGIQNAAEQVIHSNLEIVMTTNLFQYINRQDLLSFVRNCHASDEAAWKATTTWFTKNSKEVNLVLEQYDFSRFQGPFLLNTVLRESAIAESAKLKTRVFQALFSDSTKLKNSLNYENCFELKEHASDANSKKIIISFMINNISSIIGDVRFSSLTKDELIYIIKSSTMKEEVKWQAILNWVNHCPNQRNSDFPCLFTQIDLNQLSLSFIEDHIRPETLVEADRGCLRLLVDALITHAKSSKTQENASGNLGKIIGLTCHVI